MDFGEVIKFINNIFPYLVMLVGILWGWLQRKYKLPDIVVEALAALQKADVTQEAVADIIRRVAIFTDMTDVEKREMARRELQHIASVNGIELSDSTANLIIEWIFKQVKKS